MDTLHSEYTELLQALDPALMKAYKRSLNSDTLLGKKAFLNDFSSVDKEAIYCSDGDIADPNAIKRDKNNANSDRSNPNLEYTGMNRMSRNANDMSSSTTFQQTERTQHRQSEVKDHKKNNKGDSIRIL